MTKKAQRIATLAHGDQKYGDGKPYHYHLAAVAKRAEPHGPEMTAAAWLHDTMEDTELTAEFILEEFGERVAKMVTAVTQGPEETPEAYFARIKEAGPEAVLLKLLDRCANVAEGGPKVTKYKKEWPAFQAALHEPGHHEEHGTELKTALE